MGDNTDSGDDNKDGVLSFPGKAFRKSGIPLLSAGSEATAVEGASGKGTVGLLDSDINVLARERAIFKGKEQHVVTTIKAIATYIEGRWKKMPEGSSARLKALQAAERLYKAGYSMHDDRERARIVWRKRLMEKMHSRTRAAQALFGLAFVMLSTGAGAKWGFGAAALAGGFVSTLAALIAVWALYTGESFESIVEYEDNHINCGEEAYLEEDDDSGAA